MKYFFLAVKRIFSISFFIEYVNIVVFKILVCFYVSLRHFTRAFFSHLNSILTVFLICVISLLSSSAFYWHSKTD